MASTPTLFMWCAVVHLPLLEYLLVQFSWLYIS